MKATFEDFLRLSDRVEDLASEFAEWGDSIRIAAGEPAGWLEEKLTRRLVVHMADDRSFEGHVARVAPDGVVLVTAVLLGDKRVDLAGEIWLPRSKILFAQTKPEV